MIRKRPASAPAGSPFSRAVTRLRSGWLPNLSGGAHNTDPLREISTALADEDLDALSEGPLVSIVIQVLGKERRLEPLMEKLDKTTYRPFEVILVFDESHTSVDRGTTSLSSRRVALVPGNRPISPARALNIGAAEAKGEYLLFLSDALEPINHGWLGHMVAALKDDTTSAVGAQLVRLVGEGDNLTVRYVDLEVRGRASAPSPRSAVQLSTARSERSVGAIDETALLVRKGHFDSLGGFDTSFLYGLEGADLSLRLSRFGRRVINGNAMFRREGDPLLDDELGRVAGANNVQVFAEKWGARLTRTHLRRRMMDPSSGRTVAITLPPEDLDIHEADHHAALRIGRAFEAQGWDVHLVPAPDEPTDDVPTGVDLFISLVDYFDTKRVHDSTIKVAWIRKWVDRWLRRPWFEDFDIAFAATRRAGDAVADRSGVPVGLLPPAVDVLLFSPGAPPSPLLEADYVFVANNTGRGRILHDVWDVRTGERSLVLGKGWESAPRFARYWRGDLQYERLPEVYRGAKIAVDDTPLSLKTYGFINDSALEALAAGALVITDNEIASDEFFDGRLPVYRNSQEFRGLIDNFVADDAGRTHLAASLREKVLTNYDAATVPLRILNGTESILYRPAVALKIAAPSKEVAPHWGDTHLANGMAAALREHGFRTRVDLLPDWDLPKRQEVDVVIHIRGRKTYVPKPAHINVMWLISHPDEVTPSECDGYDLVLVASRDFAEHLAPLTSAPVHFMPQATDGRRFVRGSHPKQRDTDVLFVGNTRGRERPVVEWALQQSLPLTVYGRGWEGLPDAVFAGDYVPNEELPSLYRSAGVVLNDHWPDMRERGFVSNRIFDVLGSGGVVVSDPVRGLEDLFGDLVPTYRTPTELAELVETLLKDPTLRQKIADRGAQLVKEEHTFDRRAERIVDILRPQLESFELDLQGTTPKL